ncbi:MAG: NAD(P)-dependent oxidoreductase [Sphingobacteriales bacterium]|nr:NAD(P)-dependent oxidoreductase [Sphingobacteriales bacterium]
MIQNNRLALQEYERNFADIHPPFDNQEAVSAEANRCLFCYDAPCTKSCPTSINVPQFIKQIATGNIKGAAKTIFDSNIMGAGCSRVCPVEKLCEGSCVYNLLHEEPIQIARLQRHATETAIEQQWKLYERKAPNNKRVAIVGAGPAGLSCAHALALQGVEVTVFEKEAKGGGLMTYGVAAYKVSPEFCEAEVNWITSIGGIDVRYQQELGKDFSLEDLRRNYDAVFLGIGVGLTRNLGIEGENLEGVVDAIAFIYDLRTQPHQQVPVGNKVAVIGMGMTAIDAATQSKRLGAQEVTILYRRTENEKPCTDVELDIAKLDGCNIVWLAAPKEIIGENGEVKQLVCSKMKLGEVDASGRRSPVDSGETFVLDIDMLIKATGQMPYQHLVQMAAVNEKSGKIQTSAQGATNIAGVFAGGDCVNGGKEVVDAVQAGKVAAQGILEYLALA